MAVGGAAYLVSKAIKKARVMAFGDLGMEAIYEFEVEDMPVTVAVDSRGESIHRTGPALWQQKIRVGHEDKPFKRARIVLDVVEPLIGRIEQEFFEQESLFTITVFEESPK